MYQKETPGIQTWMHFPLDVFFLGGSKTRSYPVLTGHPSPGAYRWEVSGEVVRMAWQSTVGPPTTEMPQGQIHREARDVAQGVTHTTVFWILWEFLVQKKLKTSPKVGYVCMLVEGVLAPANPASFFFPQSQPFLGQDQPKMSATSLNQTSSHSVRSLFLWNRQMETKSLVSLFTFTWGGKSLEALGSWTRNHHLCAPYFLVRHSANVAYVTGTQLYMPWCENVKQKISSIGRS